MCSGIGWLAGPARVSTAHFTAHLPFSVLQVLGHLSLSVWSHRGRLPLSIQTGIGVSQEKADLPIFSNAPSYHPVHSAITSHFSSDDSFCSLKRRLPYSLFLVLSPNPSSTRTEPVVLPLNLLFQPALCCYGI